MHPHLPNQTVLLPAQVDPGAHHSGYRKFRQGPSQLTKSEVPFSPVACCLSPVVRVRRPVFPPPAESDQITHITSLCSLPFSPPSPVASVLACSPHSVHENQLHQLDKVHAYNRTCSISKRTDSREPKPGRAKHTQSSAGKPAVNSRRHPVKRLA